MQSIRRCCYSTRWWFTGNTIAVYLQEAHILPYSRCMFCRFAALVAKMIFSPSMCGKDCASVRQDQIAQRLATRLHYTHSSGYRKLRVPNIYMSEDDIQSDGQPSTPVAAGEQYLVLHWIQPAKRLHHHPEHNSHAR
jgi:hypothetical protein